MSFAKFLFCRSVKLIDKHILLRRCHSQKNVNLADAAVQKYLKSLMIEFDRLQSKARRSPEEVHRIGEIKPIVYMLEQRITLFDSIESLKQLVKKDEEDPEVKKMIKEEAGIYLSRMKDIDSELEAILMAPYLTDGGVLLEVVAGAGGQEAMLFARELFSMYHSYAEYKEWEVNIASIEESDKGGIRKASMLIEGMGVPQFMRLEAGVHRVQRIPATERSGRIHTSTVSVAVLPQPSEVEVDLPDKDLTIETKRASGAGGQHVNTTDSAVRIIHNPTGTTVECQEGRSQIKNKEIAMQKLRTLLHQKQTDAESSKIKAERKSQIGTGERNEKIRTYNYPQDRVTEHRPGGGTTHNLQVFMQGSQALEKMQESLLKQQRHDQLMEEIKEYVLNDQTQNAGSS